MGVQISDIVPKKEISISDLKGKIVAVDAFNTLYQFLTTIRQYDGTPLMDSKGRITSHISGLFYRNINLLQEGIKPVYVFDGEIPELKQEEIEKRTKAKEQAKQKYQKAKERGDEKDMRKYSSQFVQLTDSIINDAKKLLDAMGIPIIEALGEGEAEASYLARNNLAWAAASQDYDALLYGTPKLVRNLTLARKRKTPTGYAEVKPELIEFETLLNHLQIDKDQLICLGILVGTDYNPGGIKGIGQKRALDIVQRNKFPVKIFEYIKNSEKYELDFNWQEIFKQFKEYECCKTEKINFKKLDKEKVKQILLEHDFSENRINSGLEKLEKVEQEKKQKGLGEFF